MQGKHLALLASASMGLVFGGLLAVRSCESPDASEGRAPIAPARPDTTPDTARPDSGAAAALRTRGASDKKIALRSRPD